MPAGRPPHKPTRKTRGQVTSLARIGTPHEHIAAVIGVAEGTLRKHYARELELATIEANDAIGRTLFSQAKRGNTAAMIFWAKARMGWREKQALEVSGADGGPLVVEVVHRYVNTPGAPPSTDRSPGASPEPATGSGSPGAV